MKIFPGEIDVENESHFAIPITLPLKLKIVAN